jgi:hypothetical protein
MLVWGRSKLDSRQLKQKLRQLKKIELIVRFGSADTASVGHRRPLIWDSFFSDKTGIRPKYPFATLFVMNSEGRKRVFADYLYTVYTEGYKERGMLLPAEFDYHALFDFDLPAGASREDVKKRFRELAHIAHPDHGGSNEAMAALLEQYHKLIN